MKLEIIRDLENKFVGYTIEAETEEEEKNLNLIRDFYYWASFRYDGRRDNPETHNVKELAFARPDLLPAGCQKFVFDYKYKK